MKCAIQIASGELYFARPLILTENEDTQCSLPRHGSQAISAEICMEEYFMITKPESLLRSEEMLPGTRRSGLDRGQMFHPSAR